MIYIVMRDRPSDRRPCLRTAEFDEDDYPGLTASGAEKQNNVLALNCTLHIRYTATFSSEAAMGKATRLEPHGSKRGGSMLTSFQSDHSSFPSLCFQSMYKRGGGL